MASPKPSDLIPVHFRLSRDDLARLDAYAIALGLYVEEGPYRGQPNRTAALRDAIRGLDPDAIPPRRKTGR